jgi:uncharacterized membrane protein YheB (UPF0754 family)
MKYADEAIEAVRDSIMRVGDGGTYEAILAQAAADALLPHIRRLNARLEAVENILNRLDAVMDFSEPLCGDAMIFVDNESINNVMSDAALALRDRDEDMATWMAEPDRRWRNMH